MMKVQTSFIAKKYIKWVNVVTYNAQKHVVHPILAVFNVHILVLNL
jgi:hypothetical protein